MADDDDETKEAKPPAAPATPNPDHLTKSDLEAHKRETAQYMQAIRDEIAELHSSDKTEREELKAKLAEAQEYIESIKKAEAERDKVKDSKSTMVVPPEDIPPQQVHPTPPSEGGQEHATVGGATDKPKRSWKDAW